jgi:hypothetical protein
VIDNGTTQTYITAGKTERNTVNVITKTEKGNKNAYS